MPLLLHLKYFQYVFLIKENNMKISTIINYIASIVMWEMEGLSLFIIPKLVIGRDILRPS